ncbi:hypothetical protein [Paenibacillus sp. MER 99-2]|uniref:hypothetical protein n=1 Tax=Paenibacillus sp. MER 99-2 TaxID=2939572 RepID=UPI0020416D0B|nr:hypothetical protein [Paenibacillus sp. MER 99-2]MCM3172054.1 hypothetical protein [Paenibacillus sp. MER 99-2]
MNKVFEEAKGIIQNIDWSHIEFKRPSYIVLLSEHLRRSSLFYDYLHKDSMRTIVFNPMELIDMQLPEKVLEKCMESLQNVEGIFVREVCKHYLEWAYLIGEGVPIAVQFKELYLPIIKLFERGGRIQYDKGLLIIGGLTCSRFVSSESSLFEPEDISESYLDVIDKDVFNR